ncbi:uncharacterized protein [Prorops nasuta]|uniref:uncharacterized protein isoform X3 n=1 Tax=Prorops nasuta TaxID=863751 RepID=UPI0034CD66A6
MESRKRKFEKLGEEIKLMEKYVKLKKKIAEMGESELIPGMEPDLQPNEGVQAEGDSRHDEGSHFEDEMESIMPVGGEYAENILNQKEVDQFDPLDEDILKILGEDPTSSKALKLSLNPSVERRWVYWLQKGISKESKEELLKKYERPSLFEAPKLNLEIKSSLSESILRKDDYFCNQQNSVGTALAALGTAFTMLLNLDESGMNKLEFLEKLGDMGKILTNLQFELCKARKAFILPGLEKDMKIVLAECTSDEWLFGDQLADKIKEVKVAKKLSQEIKTITSRKPLRENNNNHLNSKNLSLKKPPYLRSGWKRGEMNRPESSVRKSEMRRYSSSRNQKPYRNPSRRS